MSFPSKLRVALEATSLLGPRTGVGTMTDALLSRLAVMDDIELTGVLVSLRGRGQLEAMLPPGVRATSVAFPARVAHLLWQRANRPAVKSFDVVHGPNFVVPPGAGAAELVTIHDFGPWHSPKLVNAHARAYPCLVDRAIARGAHVHVVSRFVGDEAAEILGLDRDRIHVVGNGFTHNRAVGSAASDAKAGQSMAGGPYVLSLGTIEPRKDLPTLVAAMNLVWDEHPDLRLVVAGADGWGSDAYAVAVDRLDPAKAARVQRLGYVTDAERSDLLAGAACLAFPSVYEGFGLPPLEAMANDCPVVTTTAGSLPEVCGDAALMVEPSNPEALASAIEAVVADASQAAHLIERGRLRLEHYSWDKAAQEMASLYRSLADRNR